MKPYYQDDSVTIYHGDCREILPMLEPVDLVLTDPPYGTGYAPRGGNVMGTIDYNSRDIPSWDVFSMDWITLLRHIPMGVFCPIKAIVEVMRALETDQSLFYIKTNPNPLGTSIEACVVRGVSIVSPQHFLAYNAFNGQTHPTQKPVELMRWIVKRMPEGEIVDPFMGSGTTLRAAKDLGRKAIGIEIEEKYCEIAAKRMSQSVMELSIS